jgi:hypothetical protein
MDLPDYYCDFIGSETRYNTSVMRMVSMSGVGLRSIEISSAGIEEVSAREKERTESCSFPQFTCNVQYKCFAIRLIVEISSSTASKSTGTEGTLAYLIMRG